MKSPLSFKTISYAEGISFLFLLFVAMPLKYAADAPEAVKYTGWVHGILFMVYLGAAIHRKMVKGWDYFTTGLALLAAILPFGPFLFHHFFEKKKENGEK